jgi:hypothetical protein
MLGKPIHVAFQDELDQPAAFGGVLISYYYTVHEVEFLFSVGENTRKLYIRTDRINSITRIRSLG